MKFNANAADQATGLFDSRRLAEYLNVRPATIRTMRKRNKLPEPTAADINGGAVWAEKTIVSYFTQEAPSSPFAGEAKSKFSYTIDPEKPKVLDLFAGCGGLTLGFQKAGFEVVAGFDNWQNSIDVYNDNLDHPCYKLDLGDLSQAKAQLAQFKSDVSMIIGGPPCQDFSSAGKRQEADKADLTEKFANIVVDFSPQIFVMENVARAKNAAVFRRAVETFRGNGYGITEIVLNASLCGVPQARKRLFTIGAKGFPDDAFRTELEANLSERPRSIRDHFGSALELDHYYRHPRSYARRGIYSIDEPSATIRGVNRPVPPGYKLHPGDKGPITDELRPLTTKERALVQTFPEGFSFGNVKTHAEQMIGNAVPVNLARYVAAGVWKTYSKIRCDERVAQCV